MRKFLFIAVVSCGLASAPAEDSPSPPMVQPSWPQTAVSAHDRTQQSIPADRQERADILEEKLEFIETSAVSVDVLMVALPMQKLQPLLVELRDPTTLGTAQKKLMELVNRKEAQLIDWPQAITQQGIRGVSDSVTEKRYPIEFGLPELAKEKPAEGRGVHAAIPTTFETRNVGTTLNFNVALSPDGKSATIQIAVRTLEFLRFDSFVGWRSAEGQTIEVQQPIVINVAANATVTLKDGERRLIHASKLADADDLACVFIAGVQIPGAR